MSEPLTSEILERALMLARDSGRFLRDAELAKDAGDEQDAAADQSISDDILNDARILLGLVPPHAPPVERAKS